MNQKQIDAMAEALRAQGLTWGQINFAVSLARKAVTAEREKLVRVLEAAVALVCAPAWDGVSDEDCALERVLRECGYVAAPAEHAPSRAERRTEKRHAEMRADAFGDRF